jgi:DNA polymerase III alpha subunit
LEWTEDDIVVHVRLRPGDVMDGALQDQSVDELWSLTRSTYSPWKQDFLQHATDDLTPGHSLREYVERLEYELRVIKAMGFNTYFLIVQDFIVRAKTNQIMV